MFVLISNVSSEYIKSTSAKAPEIAQGAGGRGEAFRSAAPTKGAGVLNNPKKLQNESILPPLTPPLPPHLPPAAPWIATAAPATAKWTPQTHAFRVDGVHIFNK